METDQTPEASQRVPIELTQEQIGRKILSVGIKYVGSVGIPSMKVFIGYDGGYYMVPNASLHRFSCAQSAASYGKEGKDYYKVKTIKALNVLINKHLD